jgi:outer membrane protein assembly factor BamD (BamD/ComL family)
MIRIVTAGALLAALGSAPLQCRHDPDPNLRREDDSGDALYALAQDFRAKGNEDAAKQTLRFLVERYPSNRHVPAARAELGGDGAMDPKTDAGK